MEDPVVGILDDFLDKLANVKELILSPQSHLERVRHFLNDHGFRILEEEFLKEDGKYYVVIRAVHGKQQYDKECFYRFGEELILAKHPVLLEYLDQEYVKYSKIKKVLQTIQKNTSEDEKKKWKIYLEISWRHFVIMNCRELITFLEQKFR